MKGLWGVGGSNRKDFERAQYNECKKTACTKSKEEQLQLS